MLRASRWAGGGIEQRQLGIGRGRRRELSQRLGHLLHQLLGCAVWRAGVLFGVDECSDGLADRGWKAAGVGFGPVLAAGKSVDDGGVGLAEDEAFVFGAEDGLEFGDQCCMAEHDALLGGFERHRDTHAGGDDTNGEALRFGFLGAVGDQGISEARGFAVDGRLVFVLADGDVFVGGEGTEDGELKGAGLAVDFGLNDARLLLWRDDKRQGSGHVGPGGWVP